mmetsp:Transcript_1230/g.1886  ORF Transcript_1230/g.1886 Transcript_1230/m.1886 type:complete len:372 (+) Transcript_1230:51-1166(+)
MAFFRLSILAAIVLLVKSSVVAFLSPLKDLKLQKTRKYPTIRRRVNCLSSSTFSIDAVLGFFDDYLNRGKSTEKLNLENAKDIVSNLVINQNCYSSAKGAEEFAEACASDVVYEDCFLENPVIGKEAVRERMLLKVRERGGIADSLRLDRISDGKKACGFAWAWISGNNMEGLRGTTFVELNEVGKIVYVREIPESIYKPGDLTVKLLEAVTKNAKPTPFTPYQKKTPVAANEIVKYLFNEVQGSEIEESMRFFDESIVYRDFNFENVLRGKNEVRKFINDFSFPGIVFKLQKVDDGVLSSSFTWEVEINGAKGPKGISLYELNPDTNLINYVRDIPESAIKPPPLGALARVLRPGVGVFQAVAIGSREIE